MTQQMEAASPESLADHHSPPLHAEPTMPVPLSIPVPRTPQVHSGRMQRLYDKVEAFVSKLSMRDNFWNSICSLIWLPLAFFSGVRLKELDQNSFAARAVLPFRRFNR